MPIAIGTSAPHFTLKTLGSDGLKDVTPGDNKGKSNVLLLFFPGAFTGVCTDELCSISKGIQEYEGLNAVVYGISTDSPFAQAAWAKESGITVPLLSDYKHEVVKAFGVELADLVGLGPSSSRAAVVIDKAGNVAYAEQTPTPHDLPNFDAVKKVLASLS